MKKNLLRALLLVCALTVTSLALADPWTDSCRCYIQCSNGTTAGPYWTTGPGCCQDFQSLCGDQGLAYCSAGQIIYDCPLWP
jgi:hypothetical protein